MPSRLIQVQDNDLISVEQRADEQPKTALGVHLSEEIIVSLILGELEDLARWAVEEITAKHIVMKDDKFRIDVWKEELESDTELLEHLNYVIKFFWRRRAEVTAPR
jgi:hypothetical protein